jgi:hypothetical protein
MKFLHHIGTFAAILVCAGFTAVHADNHLALASPANDWQLRRLMTPTPSQFSAESKGRVFIYDSLEIDQVEAAMDANFERIENMMFIRIHHPPETEGGTPTVEDDDC